VQPAKARQGRADVALTAGIVGRMALSPGSGEPRRLLI